MSLVLQCFSVVLLLWVAVSLARIADNTESGPD